MLVGMRCHCKNCENHFCRPVVPQDSIYQGERYIYTAHADPPFDNAMRSRVQRFAALQEEYVYISVIGGMSGIDLLATDGFNPSEIFLFDANPWMTDFCRMVLEIIEKSKNRLEYVSRMFQRNVTSPELRYGDIEPPDLGRSARVIENTLRVLTPQSRCVYRWLARGRSSVCEKVLLLHDPTVGPSLNPHTVNIKTRKKNECSFYFGHGWLRNEETFNAVKTKLRGRTSVVGFDAFQQSVSDITNKTPIVYTSNVFWHTRQSLQTSTAGLHIQRSKGQGFVSTQTKSSYSNAGQV